PSPPVRFREEDLDVADPPLAEARLRGRQVEVPEPPEPLVVTVVAQLLPGGEEALAPARQGRRVVRGDVVEPDLAQLGYAGDGIRDPPHRGQAAAGEDVGVGEAPRRLLDLEEAVVDGDRLQQE